MPIEIRELVISARVDPAEEHATPLTTSSTSGNVNQQKEIVKACVKEVLRILEDKRER